MKRLAALLMLVMIIMPISGVVKADANSTISRMEALMLVLEATGYDKKALEEVQVCPFTDVDEEQQVYVGYAYYKKLTYGVSDVEFAPDRIITREEFLAIVLRLIGYNASPTSTWLYERAEMSGIYPEKCEGDFTENEEKDILVRALYANCYSNGSKLKDLSGVTIGDEFVPLVENAIVHPYTSALSEVSSKLGVITFDEELPYCRILFGNRAYATMHGSRGNGYVIFKDNGEILLLPLFYKDNWNMAMPDEIIINDSGTELCYTYTCKQDIVNPWNGVDILQKAGFYKYTVNLQTCEIIRQVVE